jgi:hypothetical protein
MVIDTKDRMQEMMVKTLTPGNYAVDYQGKVYDKGILCATMGNRSEGIGLVKFMGRLAELCMHKVTDQF